MRHWSSDRARWRQRYSSSRNRRENSRGASRRDARTWRAPNPVVPVWWNRSKRPSRRWMRDCVRSTSFARAFVLPTKHRSHSGLGSRSSKVVFVRPGVLSKRSAQKPHSSTSRGSRPNPILRTSQRRASSLYRFRSTKSRRKSPSWSARAFLPVPSRWTTPPTPPRSKTKRLSASTQSSGPRLSPW